MIVCEHVAPSLVPLLFEFLLSANMNPSLSTVAILVLLCVVGSVSYETAHSLLFKAWLRDDPTAKFLELAEDPNVPTATAACSLLSFVATEYDDLLPIDEVIIRAAPLMQSRDPALRAAAQKLLQCAQGRRLVSSSTPRVRIFPFFFLFFFSPFFCRRLNLWKPGRKKRLGFCGGNAKKSTANVPDIQEAHMWAPVWCVATFLPAIGTWEKLDKAPFRRKTLNC
jgi:hypothetical protein